MASSDGTPLICPHRSAIDARPNFPSVRGQILSSTIPTHVTRAIASLTGEMTMAALKALARNPTPSVRSKNSGHVGCSAPRSIAATVISRSGAERVIFVSAFLAPKVRPVELAAAWAPVENAMTTAKSIAK